MAHGFDKSEQSHETGDTVPHRYVVGQKSRLLCVDSKNGSGCILYSYDELLKLKLLEIFKGFIVDGY